MNSSLLLLLFLLTLGLPQANGAEDPANIDPLESINRPLFTMNDSLDKFIVRPLASGYDFLLPDFAQRGMSNFFANMYDANAAVNSILQFRFDGAARSTGRFLLNSTVGLLGFFDVATKVGISPYRTDFGHTLATWGVPSGPYLMVPFFGPRTLRSGTGTVFDSYVSVPAYTAHLSTRNSLWGLELVDGRSRLLQVDELLSGDRYIFVRDVYLQQRQMFVNDGVITDHFSDYEEEAWGTEF